MSELKNRYPIPQSTHFYVDELIHPNIYKRFGKYSLKFMNPKLLNVLAIIRNLIKEPIVVNSWGSGGNFINSGLRDFKKPLNGKLSYSRHYYGLCLDLKPKTMTIKRLFKIIKENESLFIEAGLTVIEDIRYTPTWLHISVEYTGLPFITTIKP